MLLLFLANLPPWLRLPAATLPLFALLALQSMLRTRASSAKDAARIDDLSRVIREYEVSLEVAGDFICRFAPDGRILYVSPSVKSVLGYTVAEALKYTTIELMHPDDLQRLKRVVEANGASDEKLVVRGRVRHADGRWITLESTMRLLFYGDHVEVVTSNRDIDRQLEEVRELEQMRIRLEEAVLIAGIGYWERRRLPGGGWENFINAQGKAILGLSGEENDPDMESILALLVDGERERLEHELMHCLENGTGFTTEVRVQRRDTGEKRVLLLRARPRYEGERVHSFQGTSIDITQLRQAERGLQLARETMENAPISVIRLDPELRLRYTNQMACRLCNTPMHKLLGRELSDVLPTNPPLDWRAIWEEAAQGESVTRISRLVQQSKEGPVLELSLSVLEMEGEPRGILFLVDIGERVRMEEELRQSQKMEAVGRLAGGIAHDFNNLLQVIAGTSELLRPYLRDTGQPLLKEIRDTTDRAQRLVRQLLSFSRRQELRLESVDLNEIVYSAIGMLHRLLEARVRVEPALCRKPLQVYVDRVLLEQVMLNLCLNARDAMPQGGRITLTSSRQLCAGEWCRARELEPGEYACLMISDDGPGVPSELRTRIFEPFFSTKESGQGAGLGLATAYAILQRHGGRIELGPLQGQGACFVVYLPLHHVEEKESTPAEQPVLEPGSTSLLPRQRQLLLVEDDDAVRRTAVRQLEQMGWRTINAEDGFRALELFEHYIDELDLVILDVVLPSLSGLDVAEVIRERNPDLPLLFCSGYTREILEDEYSMFIPGPLLTKPWQPQDLQEAIKLALDGDDLLTEEEHP